jgi:hypothetical protein
MSSFYQKLIKLWNKVPKVFIEWNFDRKLIVEYFTQLNHSGRRRNFLFNAECLPYLLGENIIH